MTETKIVLVGGVAGVGKTTIARELVYRYGIYQRVGTGFIREICKTLTKNPCLDSHTYLTSEEPAYEHLVRQTLAIKNAINCCIDRAYREGTSLVIEGNHCIPWVLNNKKVSHAFILFVDDEKKHWKLLTGKSHKNRVITQEDFARIREMQYSLTHLAEINGVQMIESGRDLKKVLEDIEEIIK